jgi:hypothetical protein
MCLDGLNLQCLNWQILMKGLLEREVAMRLGKLVQHVHIDRQMHKPLANSRDRELDLEWSSNVCPALIRVGVWLQTSPEYMDAGAAETSFALGHSTPQRRHTSP